MLLLLGIDMSSSEVLWTLSRAVDGEASYRLLILRQTAGALPALLSLIIDEDDKESRLQFDSRGHLHNSETLPSTQSIVSILQKPSTSHADSPSYYLVG